MGTISSLGVGSGLDLNGLLGQLQEAEQQKLAPIQEQIQDEESQISAYGQVKGDLSGLQATASKLDSPELYESLTTNVEGSGLTAVTSSDAQPGSYEVAVNDLASTGNLATQRLADPEAAATDAQQTLTFSFNEGAQAEFTIAEGSSLEGIRDAINTEGDERLNASIINDGEGYRLAVNTTQTGEDASVTATNFNAVIDPAALAEEPDTTIQQMGQDASLNVNGIDIVSSTNQVEGAVQGVTLNLQEANSSATVSVAQDEQAITEAVSEFVEGFNNLKGRIGELTAFNPETGRAGELNGDSATRNVESTLRGVLSSSVEGGELSVLSDIGISLELDGTLSLDQNKLESVASNDPDALASFFAGDATNEGMAERLDSAIGQMLNETGAVQNAISGSERRVESLNDRLGRTEERISDTVGRYRTQFSQLDTMVADMNSTSNYLNQQLSAINSQGGSGGLL